jgi:hypothetical protein
MNHLYESLVGFKNHFLQHNPIPGAKIALPLCHPASHSASEYSSNSLAVNI